MLAPMNRVAHTFDTPQVALERFSADFHACGIKREFAHLLLVWQLPPG